MNGDTIIALVMLFLGCMIGVAVTICIYSSITSRKIAEFYRMNYASLAEYLANLVINVNLSLAAYEQIQDGHADVAGAVLADQIAGFAAFASTQPPPSLATSSTVKMIESACGRHVNLRQRVEQRTGKGNS